MDRSLHFSLTIQRPKFGASWYNVSDHGLLSIWTDLCILYWPGTFLWWWWRCLWSWTSQHMDRYLHFVLTILKPKFEPSFLMMMTSLIMYFLIYGDISLYFPWSYRGLSLNPNGIFQQINNVVDDDDVSDQGLINIWTDILHFPLTMLRPT